jgi:hypothetical protein
MRQGDDQPAPQPAGRTLEKYVAEIRFTDCHCISGAHDGRTFECQLCTQIYDILSRCITTILDASKCVAVLAQYPHPTPLAKMSANSSLGKATPQPPSSPEVKPTRTVQEGIQSADDKALDLEKADDSRDTSSTPSPTASVHEDDEKTIVSFAEGDQLNPYNWGHGKKIFIVIGMMCLVMNSTIGSSIATGGTTETAKHFNVTNEGRLVRQGFL